MNFTHYIEQKLPFYEWPLKNSGDEKFFGYVVSMGAFPQEWGTENGVIHYVDFSYNDRYERYHLPEDKVLRAQLRHVLKDNMSGVAHTGDIYGKVWIRKVATGHCLTTP